MLKPLLRAHSKAEVSNNVKKVCKGCQHSCVIHEARKLPAWHVRGSQVDASSVLAEGLNSRNACPDTPL